MTHKKGRLLRDLISLCSGEVVGKIAGFIAFTYLARTLEPDLYGMVELAVAVSVIFMLIIDFGYGPIGAREVSKDFSVAKTVAARIVSARFLLALLIIPLMGITGWIIAETPEGNMLIWWFAFALFATPWDYRWLFQGLEKMNVVALGQTIRMVVFAITVILFVHSAQDFWLVGVVEFFAAFVMAIFFISMQYHYIGAVGFDFSFKPLKALSKQSASIGLSNAIWAAGQYAPTLLIATLANVEQLAWFGAAHRIAMSMIAFSLIYHFSLFPSVSKRIKTSPQAFNDFVFPSIKIAAWIGIGCALFVSLGSDYFFIYVFGKEFTQAAEVLNILIWALPVTLLSGHVRWALIAAGHQRYVFYAQTCGFITTLLVCVILVPIYHAKGGAIAMLLSTLAVWTVTHFNARRYLGNIPFIEATLQPLLVAAFSIYIYSLINSPWLGIITALITYLLGALLIDWKLPADIRTLIRIKDGELPQKETGTEEKQRGKQTDKQVVFSILLSILFLIILQIKPFEIANWLSPESTQLSLQIITQSLVFLKYFVEADILIVFVIICIGFKSTNSLSPPYYPLWKSQSVHKKHSFYETFFFPLLYGILLLALLFQVIVPGSTLWTKEILSLFAYLQISYGEGISQYIYGNQQLFYSISNKIILGLFGENDFGLYLPYMLIRISCIWASARLVRYIFNARYALIITIIFTVFSHHYLLLFENISNHALIFLGTITASELFLRCLETGKWKYGLAYAFIISITCWLSVFSIFIILLHAFIYFLLLLQKNIRNKMHWRPFWVLILSAWLTLHFYVLFLSQLAEHSSKLVIRL